ncbi:MAG: AAA family ATPase [Sterolibacteriaceae bacterium]|nr:AAA family ATPase [Sterolibacteriaceae bacterium]
MNFNDALPTAAKIALRHLGAENRVVVLVRDLFGKIRVVLSDELAGVADALAAELAHALGHYAYDPASTFLREADVRDALPGATEIAKTENGARVLVIDRQLTGTEWNAQPAVETRQPRRFTLFSMKGGVGRSTTATILAWHLARKGKRILVFDLDLESPGVGATLLGPDLPRFGAVDWFVEDALGHGDVVLPEMVRESSMATEAGRITVVPAFGSDTGDYLVKLGRAYLERGPNGHEPWPSRLKRMVEAIEESEKPDVVLLDSRTGLHDTRAALVLAMGAHTLMFAVDTPQTWSAYGFLFKHWTRHPDVASFYDKLWVVGSMVPDTEIEAYVESLRDRAWSLFDETLYAAPNVASRAGFLAPVVDDDAGNHFPRAIYWQRGLMAFNPLAKWTDQFVIAAYQSFLEWFDRVLLEEPEAP